jgi:hypothetical protein
VRRRDFITLLGSAVTAWPLAARGQQPAMPVIGWLGSESRESERDRVISFRQGLKEAGYVEGQNVAIEYRWADGQYSRLPALATDLVRRQVTAIALTGEAEPWRIRKGKWCPSCAGNRRLGVAGLRSWGATIGLELLDTEYRGGTLAVYRWRCHNKGHVIKRSRTSFFASLERRLKDPRDLWRVIPGGKTY